MDANSTTFDRPVLVSGAAIYAFVLAGVLVVHAWVPEDAARHQREHDQQVAYIAPLLHASGATGDYSDTGYYHMGIDPLRSLSGVGEQCILSYAIKVRYAWIPGRMTPFVVRYRVTEAGSTNYGNDCPAEGVFLEDDPTDFLTRLRSINKAAARRSAPLAQAPAPQYRLRSIKCTCAPSVVCASSQTAQRVGGQDVHARPMLF